VFYDCLPQKGCFPGSYEFFRCQWEKKGESNSSGEGREEKQHKVYLVLSETAAVKFNVAVGTEFSVFQIIRKVTSRSSGVN